MIKISKKVEYALISLNYLHSKRTNDELVTAKIICDKFNIPFDTTSKVMQQMCNHKILESVQGSAGGYQITSSLDQISYYQLAEIVEQKKLYKDCHEQNCKLLEKCNIVTPITTLNLKIKSYLENLSINELLHFEDFNKLSV